MWSPTTPPLQYPPTKQVNRASISINYNRNFLLLYLRLSQLSSMGRFLFTNTRLLVVHHARILKIYWRGRDLTLSLYEVPRLLSPLFSPIGELWRLQPLFSTPWWSSEYIRIINKRTLCNISYLAKKSPISKNKQLLAQYSELYVLWYKKSWPYIILIAQS